MSVVYKIQILRGNFVNLPLLSAGELAFCMDTKELWAGNGIVNTRIGGADVADGDKGDITVSVGGTVWSINAGAVGATELIQINPGEIFSRLTAGTGGMELCSLSNLLDNALGIGAGCLALRSPGGWTQSALGTPGQVLEWHDAGSWLEPIPVTKGQIVIEDQKAANTQGGTFTSGAWQTRTLNTIVYDSQSRASLSSNQITLAAGKYWVRASAPGFQCGNHQVRLETAGGTVLAYGTSETTQVGASTRSVLGAVITLGTSTALILKHRCQTTQATFGMGVANNFGGNECYARVEIDVLA